MQNTLEPLEEVLARRYPMFIQDGAEIEKVLLLYVEKKRARQLLDFDDLLSGWLRLLGEHEDVLAAAIGRARRRARDTGQPVRAYSG